MSGEKENQKTILESMDSGNEKIDAIIKTTNATFGWAESIHKFVAKHGFKQLFMSLISVGAIVMLGLWFFQPGIFAAKLEQYREEKHVEKMNERMNNTPLIQEELDKLRLQTNASWVSVWELHNSTNNLDGMPFLFASLTYESMNPALMPIGDQFDNVRLSLYPLASYLREHEMWCGTVDELREIDNTAYYRAKALGIKFLGFKIMEIEGAPNAIISMAFVEGVEVPSYDSLAQSCVFTSYKVNTLLTVTKDTRKKK